MHSFFKPQHDDVTGATVKVTDVFLQDNGFTGIAVMVNKQRCFVYADNNGVPHVQGEGLSRDIIRLLIAYGMEADFLFGKK